MCDDRLSFLSDENDADGMIRCIHKSVWKKKFVIAFSALRRCIFYKSVTANK